MPNADRPSLSTPHAQSAQEAKHALLGWSEQADAELHQQIGEIVGAARAGARKAAPWAIGAGVILGLLSRRRRAKGGDASRQGPGPLRTGIHVALELLPLVSLFLRQRQRD